MALFGLIAITGCTEPYITDAEAVVIKISPDGEKISETVITCPNIYHASSYIQTSAVEISGDGSLVIVQYPNRTTELITRAIIIDNDGKLIKDTVFPAIDNDIFDLIALENDTVVALSEDGMLYSFSLNGDLISETSVYELDGDITNSGYPFASAAPASENSIILAGEDKKPGYVQVLNISPEEKTVRETRIKIGGMPWVHKVVQTDDGDFLIGGSYSDSESFPLSRPWIAKTDDEGSLLWEHKLGNVGDGFLGFYESEVGEYHIIYASSITDEKGSTRDQYIEAIVDNSGNLVSTTNDTILKYPSLISKDGLVFTETISGTDGGKKLHIIKTNAEGETEWDSLYELTESSATSSSIGSGIVQTADGGYLITGARYYY
ncbi:hypothetical protein [Methanolacinia petrolearia]|uniref:hypothetical protein n=1 Tax=Methanolacinia petrolearia TaxID=54120 RepID=UPI00064F9907|nr:hypothetical protein [Methanolacinia petrolearia]